MAIIEIKEAEWLKLKRIGGGRDAIMFYSPFCGTCKVALRMLEIVDAAGVPTPLYKININYAGKLREAWQITSVPCLVLVENGEPVHMTYAMRSVDHLFALLKGDREG
ncbi:thioredoxin family protein [Paenibacillus daejeonensis]|uniref:thioredoxin family protein n=1 Tax=Paenibacillus daejeonensis TaxID=135193 RepID=UPI00036F7C9A|nr:thioredoxin family protein [Paenibacillus daejeonensis]